MPTKKTGWNLSQAVRDYLAANPKAKGPETYAALLELNPEIKKGSFQVAFYLARRKTRKHKRLASKAAETGIPSEQLEAIHLVKKLMTTIGADMAIKLIRAME